MTRPTPPPSPKLPPGVDVDEANRIMRELIARVMALAKTNRKPPPPSNTLV